MKIRQYICVLTVFAAVCLQGCVRDLTADYDIPYEEGLPAVISLNIEMPSMSVATRSDMPDNTDSEVSSVWVGVFSEKTGKCTYAGFHDIQLSSTHSVQSLTIKTLSGSSYIVAVGNPEDNFGWEKGESDHYELTELLPGGSKSRKDVDEFSWEDYLNIAVRQLDLNDVNTPIGNLVMSGIYYDEVVENATDEDRLKHPADWETANYTPINIQSGTNKLGGAIHLRRLISQVKFVIKAADYTLEGDRDNSLKEEARRIIEITPQSFQVRNVPYTSWLHERKSGNFGDEDYKKANSGDVIEVGNLSYSPTQRLPMKINYRSSAWFSGSQYIEPKQVVNNEGQTEVGQYEFDFWMLENKRHSSIPLGEGNEAYYKREKEYKTKKTLTGEDTSYEVDANSGIYVSLCAVDDSDFDNFLFDENDNSASAIEKETMNNCAAVVEIRCRILYTDEGLEAIRKDESGDYKEVQYRSADAVYTVHLGGIGNNWDDFTHRRNHKYTYTVTIIDIDRIIVEGRTDKEDRPGIEGVVTDVVNPPFDVDCHYHKVNIRLSNRERTGKGIEESGGLNNGMNPDDPDDRLNGNSKYPEGVFPFRVRYFDETNLAHYIDPSNINQYMDDKGKLYWTWIEFRPTTDSLTLAKYKPYNGTDGDTFRLNEVHDLEHFRHPKDDTGSDTGDTQYWYTVFVNEYVYEASSDESGNNWVNYVNLSARMCWINTLFRSSVDDESNYIRSKYVVRQPSIQTFYSVPAEYASGHDVDAIGMEHTNETLGFNLRWDGVATEYSDYNDNESHSIKNNNGRHNTLLYLLGTPDPSSGEGGSPSKKWDDYMDETTLQVIRDINTSSNQYHLTDQVKGPAYLPDDYDEDKKEYKGKYHPYYVPSIKTFTRDDRNVSYSSLSDINRTYYIRIIEACMNRNRDNNGNDIIDEDEIRWYVPASSEMVDLVLGRNSLETPLLDYEVNTNLQSPINNDVEQKHQANTRFHYATSNARVLWAEEGTTINPESDNYDRQFNKDGWNIPPQQVRCVRALGTRLDKDENKDLSPAFEVNNENYPTKIRPTFYEQKNQRAYTSTALEPHQEMTTLNRLCYYGFEFDPLLYEFEQRQVEVEVEETIDYPAGYYTDGIQDEDHYLGTDTPLDPKWKEENNNPVWRNGKTFPADEDSYYKVKPDTWAGWDGSAFADGVLVVRVDDPGWTEVVRKKGWYKLGQYSSTERDDYVHFDEFWIGGTTHEEGWFQPDISQRYDEPVNGSIYWPATTLKIEFPGGYYWPDPSSGPSEQLPDYEYFPEEFGDDYMPPGTYAPILSTRQDSYFFGSTYFPDQNWTGYAGGYYVPDLTGTSGATSQHCNTGFWIGERHDPGYYARDVNRPIDNWNSIAWYMPSWIPKYSSSIYVDGETIEAGYYKADESKKGSNNQSGFRYYPQWNDGGEHYPKGWYELIDYSETEKSGYIYLDEVVKDYPGGFYEGIPTEFSSTKQPGYGYVEWPQDVIVEGFQSGYYSDNGTGDYLGTEPELDPSAKWLPGKTEYTGKKSKKTVTVGQDTYGENPVHRLFVYHENNFVENHGATLKVANDICRERHNGDRNWRLPNLKEAALIKIAIENAGVYRQGTSVLKQEIASKNEIGKYEIGNFLSCTFRHFGVVTESSDDKTGYYTGVYYPEINEEVDGDWLVNQEDGRLLGRICCITTGYNRHYYIRCVRDLREGEFQ